MDSNDTRINLSENKKHIQIKLADKMGFIPTYLLSTMKVRFSHLPEHNPAICDNGLTGNIVGIVGCQERDKIRDVFRLLRPS